MELFCHTLCKEAGHHFSDRLKVSSTTLRKKVNYTGNKSQNM